MGSAEVEACTEILEDHFGEVVAKVGHLLLREACTLPSLIFRLHSTLRVSQIKRSLVILEQHNLVKFSREDMRIIYSINTRDVLRVAMSARCCLVAKTLYGEVAEAICEELINQGRLTCSSCLRRVAMRLDSKYSEIKEKFTNLVDTQLIMRCPKVEDNRVGCPVFEELRNAFSMPEKVLTSDEWKGKPAKPENESRKRKASELSDDPDAGIYWRLNYERFERYLRDEMIVDAVCSIESFPSVEPTIRALLKICELRTDSLAPSSYPISIYDALKSAESNGLGVKKQEIETSLQLLNDSDGIIRKVGDSAGGLYIIDFEKAVSLQCHRNVESAIREKIDSRALRIFRLLVSKGHLEEEQIEKMAMFSAKEAKELCYDLIDNHFISVRHVGKTNDFAPARTIYLYHVDMLSVVQMLYLQTCRVLRNVIIRRRYETRQHQSLIGRQLKMETIIANIEADENLDADTKKQQVEEVEEMYLTPADKTSLESYRQAQTAFSCIEVELDRVILLFTQYIEFAKRRC